ncbi:cryptochrome/deoxyribodipyrimidine photo-lyase family protein [Halovenus carboxidivorans]|uniref:cryptochrome/deoxyribodipyrimidine photo-lyase family protein n=1 Tax=Halovenus carboxidivorans TaxID=2692199 RepID=UPI003742DB3E
MALPLPADIPTPTEVAGDTDAEGTVVWHRKHLRVEDHRGLSEAVGNSDVICPLFVFDPTFYGSEGLACDSRVRFLHQSVTSLARLYAAAPCQAESVGTNGHERTSETRLADYGGSEHEDSTLSSEETGLTVGYGAPAEILARFVDRGWSVLTMATPTSRYGKRRDDRVRTVCGDAVRFVSGDGLVRDRDRTRENWQSRIDDWLTDSQHEPDWGRETTRLTVETGVTPARVDLAFDITPSKRRVPVGTHRKASKQLRSFVDRIGSYPRNISAPQDAREGTSGLSPYLNFGLFSIRQVYQYVAENAPNCRGREMFASRLVWNCHYNQKLVDWPGWTDRAVNPVFEGRNEDNHDPQLIEAWKRGGTGFPMVDASMRCLRETGWLNFRMRAMCASFFAHILKQPWWVGADWYHHHLIDSDVGINYTQWQSQAGLIGKPAQRVYNPRKQVRDHDPDGEWISRWVPELAELPSQYLPRPERTPLEVQENCGVRIGESYPRPVVDFETEREAFWSWYEQQRPLAAEQLGRPEIAKRASFSGGYEAARAIADQYGRPSDDTVATQLSLSDVEGGEPQPGGTDPPTAQRLGGGRTVDGRESPEVVDDTGSVPTGAGRETGEPSPDDRDAVAEVPESADGNAENSESDGSEQTSIDRFD